MKLSTFQQKTALITGASSGIGLCFARQLAAEGCHLILVARRVDRLRELKLELEVTYKIRVETIQLDLSTSGAAKQLVQLTDDRSLHVDILINNAGNGRQRHFNEITLDEHLNTIDLNIRALTELTYLYSTKMIANKSGYILLVGSVAGHFPVPNFASYAASKTFVNYLGIALRNEIQSSGVNVTVLNPGATKTEFGDNAGQSFSPLVEKIIYSSPEGVAKAGLEGLLKGKSQVVPGIKNKVTLLSMRFIPQFLQAVIGKLIFR